MIESLPALLGLMENQGARRFYAKKLSPNDNSKNQVYLGGDFSALNVIPHHEIYNDSNDVAGSRRDRAKAGISFFWIDEEGAHEAPGAQLVLYPKYPEVRMSGFLQGCRRAPREVMVGRDDGRVLVLGVTDEGEVLGYAAREEDAVAREVRALEGAREIGVFVDLMDVSRKGDTKALLLAKMAEIHRKGWIPSQKIGADRKVHPYRAANGGGYTLEAELEVSPNGYPEPDYLGWEVKQFGVTDFEKCRAKSPITLMTPEPNVGLYKEQGVAEFITRYGYADRNGVEDRRNFGGVYECGADYNVNTRLRLDLVGYDMEKGRITNMEGGIVLVGRDEEIAAQWSFKEILKHWNRKHAQAAYVPSLTRKPPPEYWYGPKIMLCEGTDFGLFLRAVAVGAVYYDPGMKMENCSSPNPAIKRRSQFRVKLASVPELYRYAGWSVLE